MTDQRGFYQKYQVERVDGREITGPTFTLEVDHDPFAADALLAYADAAEQAGGYDQLVADLRKMVYQYHAPLV